MEHTDEKKENLGEARDIGKGRIGWLLVLVVLCSSFFGAVFGFMAAVISPAENATGPLRWPAAFFGKQAGEERDSETLSKQRATIVDEDTVVTDMVEKVSPAVVNIIISKDVTRYRSLDPFGFFLQPDARSGAERQQVGSGSGFLVSENGMIVTNKHVVSDPSAEYTVMMNDGKEYPAQVLARDPIQDIAIIKIEGENFPILSLGDSDRLKIGQTVIAIGNSLGEFSNTVSKGIISGLKRNLTAGSVFGESERLSDIIQTDTAINRGNSGGPLLNINGEVIGVNVAMAEGAQNVGFAIPANQVKKAIEQVKKEGKISVPFLGVRYVMITPAMKEENGLPFGHGAIILRGQQVAELAVVPGSPADKAGLMENDIILEIEGTRLDEDNALAAVLSRFSVGDRIELKVYHKGETKNVQVQLENRPEGN